LRRSSASASSRRRRSFDDAVLVGQAPAQSISATPSTPRAHWSSAWSTGSCRARSCGRQASATPNGSH
jgi:hypothetical protein